MQTWWRLRVGRGGDRQQAPANFLDGGVGLLRAEDLTKFIDIMHFHRRRSPSG